MSHSLSKPLAATEELIEGQKVIIVARWMFVLTMLLLTVLAPNLTVNRLRLQLLGTFSLAIFNFYLLAQLITRKPTLQAVIYLASLADLLAISFGVRIQGGFYSPGFVFYYPALLVISVVFTPTMLFVFTSSTVIIYALLAVSTQIWINDVPFLILRLLMMVAVALCGNHFREIEQARRRAAAQAAEPLPPPPAEEPAPLSVADRHLTRLVENRSLP